MLKEWLTSVHSSGHWMKLKCALPEEVLIGYANGTGEKVELGRWGFQLQFVATLDGGDGELSYERQGKWILGAIVRFHE